ncbi:MAG: AAA family ATPase, partial [Chloroflexota bacterium]|nr:AAA family ATPase [Chloroflexota bacterium]
RREAQAMARLDHPNIVAVHEVGEEDGRPFFVCQYITGGDLRGPLREAGGPLPMERALGIAEDLCRALAHAHGRGIVHRDIKPGNILLTSEGAAKLGDFGLATAADRSRLTLAGAVVGTAAYMAPEQAHGQPADARSDLYALGCVLYEMLTGRPPFSGDDALAIISQHTNTVPVVPSWHNPEVPKPLDALVLRLLAKAPDERPASAQEVAQELRRIIELSAVEPPPSPPQAVTDLRGLNWDVFVGRREEMEQLKDALDGAISGKAALVFVAGEPGIGKTRLAEEFAVYAELRGAHVLSGRAYEGGSSLPYTPFVEALRQYTRSRPDDELRAQLGPGAPEVATLVSEIRQRFPDIEAAPPLDPEAERLRLFESVTQFVRNASAAGPIVLYLDDLHWADKPSLLLLQHLAQRTARDRLLVLGAYRDVELDRTHPLSDALGALRRLPNYHRVLLRGLPQESVIDLLTSADSSEENAPARRALAAALHKETEGNPFFVREVLSHLLEEGKIRREGGRWTFGGLTISDFGIPEGVREVIGRRLSRLSDGCNRLLTRASTMTGGFTWDALKAINPDVPEAELLDLLEDALAAQLIAERKAERSETYDFTHALIRQTLYGELSGPRRVLLHRQIGGALEKLYAANIEQHLAELAHHFYQAAPGGDVEKAIDYATRAGLRAFELYAWEEAAGHYARALQAMDLTGTALHGESSTDEQRFDLLMRLGLAHQPMGDFASARDLYERAALVAKAAGLAEQQALAAARYAGRFDLSDDPAPLIAMLEEALAGLPEGDSPARALVMARLVRVQYFTAPCEDVAETARAAVGVARRINDPATLSGVLESAHIVLSGPESVEERIAIVDELLALASARGDRFAAHDALLRRIIDLAEIGDIDGAQRDLEANLAFAREVRFAGPMWGASAALAMRPLLEGRFDEAERLMQEALVLGQQVQGDGPVLAFGVQLVGLRFLQGRLAEVEPLVRAQVKQFPNLVASKCALALVHAEIDSAEEARREFEELAAEGFAALPRDASWLVGICMLIEVCDYFGDVARATTLYDLLLPYAGRNIIVGQPALCTGSASRQLGMLAAVMEQYDVSERHFEDALAFDQKMNARPWVAHDQYHYAKMLLARAAPGDGDRALALLQAALDTAEELGMKKIIERALALKKRAQAIDGRSI